MSTAYDRIRIWSPTSEEVRGSLKDGIASCLANAFGSGPWASRPMPIGTEDDPHSAKGIIAGLSDKAQILVASTADTFGERIVGCVLGGILDDSLVNSYGLAPYGAGVGDGLLAYIGVAPQAQGRRIARAGDQIYTPAVRRCGTVAGPEGDSLSGVLFERWLGLASVTASPRVFVRTRRVLKPILHLAEKNGFDYRGQFHLTFQGEAQERMVFGRSNRGLMH